MDLVVHPCVRSNIGSGRVEGGGGGGGGGGGNNLYHVLVHQVNALYPQFLPIVQGGL